MIVYKIYIPELSNIIYAIQTFDNHHKQYLMMPAKCGEQIITTNVGQRARLLFVTYLAVINFNYCQLRIEADRRKCK